MSDRTGLRWICGGRRERETRIEWHEVQAFWMLAPPFDMPGLVRAYYVLDSGAYVFSWSIPEVPTAAQLADNIRLCRLTVTRTGLPLRDCSAAVAAVTQAREEGRRAMRALVSGDSPDTPAEFASVVSGHKSPRTARWLLASQLMILILLAALYGGSWMLQRF